MAENNKGPTAVTNQTTKPWPDATSEDRHEAGPEERRYSELPFGIEAGAQY